MSFADSIIKLRSEIRISQKELADELNVSCATVNRWENGRTVPNKMTMFVIREYCKRNSIDFAYEGDEKKRGDAV
ncbi:MAG: helix-turn-helix transcriptional regulator [Sphaerochaetaceae bacterium]|jgi:transcriptional regulator with XRE-family HTH domain|nr:helix-turn-helix transcriptional regulator [Sphaerochaetaceae bacterium]MDD3162492.1 helix-turn-helix transcriptional regulator [Sphaerochaetaceae bacterium]MDD4006820.1 helix-turn-helix transcriptional regulator [Sphaerochaetaceae bacterium]MDD4396268.1 helix-turn-helix transcriptional regulator [Sphaerochaetaceae bacterium]